MIYLAGKRVRFTSGEYEGERGVVLGSIPRRYRNEAVVYRIQIDGYPKPGGWDGKVLSTDLHFTILG